MFWLLLAAVVLLSLVVLAATLLTLWRSVKVLGREVGAAGDTVGALQSTLEGARADGPLGAGPCPTCGAPPRLAASRPTSVRRPGR